jgi:uncharacterized MAPEG superfamily protein
MENLFALFPVKVNPFFALLGLLVLAYVPHILKKSVLQSKLKSHGKQYATANSRGLSAISIDDSPTGMKIANMAGCHQNGLEAFSYFSVAVLSSVVTKVNASALSGACGLFILIRLLYTYVYLGSLNGSPRTYLFFASAFITAALFWMAGNNYADHL